MMQYRQQENMVHQTPRHLVLVLVNLEFDIAHYTSDALTGCLNKTGQNPLITGEKYAGLLRAMIQVDRDSYRVSTKK